MKRKSYKPKKRIFVERDKQRKRSNMPFGTPKNFKAYLIHIPEDNRIVHVLANNAKEAENIGYGFLKR